MKAIVNFYRDAGLSIVDLIADVIVSILALIGAGAAFWWMTIENGYAPLWGFYAALIPIAIAVIILMVVHFRDYIFKKKEIG